MPSWVIIGASRGIGYQYLKTLSQDPSNTVFGVVRTPSSTQTKVDSDCLHNVHIIKGDLDSVASLSAAAEQVSRLTNGVVDLPIGYAGKEDFFISELNKSIATNVAGVLFSVNAFISLIRESKIKKVIAISSAAGDIEANTVTEKADGIPYAISKAGLNLLVAKLAIAYKNEGIAFLALNPGFVLTMVDDPENILPQLSGMIEHFSVALRKLEPDFKGPILPEESVKTQLKVIEGLTMERSGAFLGRHGDKRWG